MPDPVDPARFAHPDDVSARWILGDWTAGDVDWDAWAQERIIDVEAQLIGLVPSLGTFDPLTDPRRARAVKTLVADKVTELRANPRGLSTVSQSMDGFTANEQTRAHTTSQAIWFSEQELDSVRAAQTRRRFGTIYVGPGPERMLTIPFPTVTVTPKRRVVDFGEATWVPLAPIDVCYLLDEPVPIMTENSWRYTQDGKLYARRGVDLKDGDMVPLPPGQFGVIGDAQLDFVHPMTGYDYGWVRFTIRRGG